MASSGGVLIVLILLFDAIIAHSDAKRPLFPIQSGQ
jgi:hypothetical protein